MSLISNTPTQTTILRLENRKSFSLGIWLKDNFDQFLDITGCTLRLVAKKTPFAPDDAYNLVVNAEAVLVYPTTGYARFDLQATDLYYEPGEYPFVIVLLTAGYSAVLVKGVLELLDNPESESMDSEFVPADPMTTLQVKLRDRTVIEVTAGYVQAPNTHSFTTDYKTKLDSIEFGAQANTLENPPGGFPGNFLAKTASGLQWVAGGGSGGGLDATGVPAGWVPTSNGADNWTWEELLADVVSVNGATGVVVLDLDDVGDTSTRLALTPAERTAIGLLDTAATHADTDFLPSTGIAASDTVSGVFDNARIPRRGDLRGFSEGTSAPSGGVDGDEYFQYEI